MNPLIADDEDKKMLAKALRLYFSCKKTFTTLLKHKHKDLLDWINHKTAFLDSGKYSNQTKLYCIKNGITQLPLCMYCKDGTCPLGKDPYIARNIDSFEYGWHRACTLKCPNMQKAKQRKLEKTCLERYGASNFLASDEGKHAKQDWCNKHGVENPFQLESVKKKAAASRKASFGAEYTMQSASKRKLASDRYKAKTGYAHQFMDPEVQQKAKQTIEARASAGEDLQAARRLANRRRRYKSFIESSEIKPLFTEAEFCRLDKLTQYTSMLRWQCKKCGKVFDACIDQNFSSRNALPVRCTSCHPMLQDGTSAAEIEIIDFIKSVCTSKVVQKDRSAIAPYELDVLIPSKKLAFELDGLYWHSMKSKQYHLMKTELCEQKGLQLVHIFEDEWRDKKDIVKSRIKNLLGHYSKTVYARKCEVREVSSRESSIFQDASHLQGSVKAKVHLGLFDRDELVSLMTFGKSRFSKKHEWEMLRFCSKLGYHVVGAAGKLLKCFERTFHPKSLVTYADRRWSQGKLYRALGFTQIGMTPPNYWYLDKTCSHRLSRIQFQKHKLKSKLAKFDPSKTEMQNMLDNGFSVIYDCGNYVFSKV